MKYRLVDLLACPMCKHFPLELLVFERERGELGAEKIKCEVYCGYRAKEVKELVSLDCVDCSSFKIIEGLLACPSCARWYPIEEEIPRMLPDELRKKEEDLSFLKKHGNKIPRKILENGKPFAIGK